jgi:hypothetical protein
VPKKCKKKPSYERVMRGGVKRSNGGSIAMGRVYAGGETPATGFAL